MESYLCDFTRGCVFERKLVDDCIVMMSTTLIVPMPYDTSITKDDDSDSPATLKKRPLLCRRNASSLKLTYVGAPPAPLELEYMARSSTRGATWTSMGCNDTRCWRSTYDVEVAKKPIHKQPHHGCLPIICPSVWYY